MGTDAASRGLSGRALNRLRRQNARRVVAFAGHSFIADGAQNDNQRMYYSYGPQFWVRALTDHRIYTDPALTFATPGITLQTWISNFLSAVLVANPDYLVLDGITNSLSSGVSLATLQAQLNTVFAACGGKGITVIPVLVTPRSGASVLSAGQEVVRNLVNGWLMRQQQRNDCRVIVANPLAALTDFATGAVVTSYQRTSADGLHLGQDGMRRYSQAIADILNGDIPPMPPMGFLDADDVFNTSTNPSGNGLANGLMAGSAAATGGATGNGPTSWTARGRNAGNTGNATTLAVAFSKVTHGLYPTLPLTQMALSGTSTTGDFGQLFQSGSGYQTGDQVVAGCYVEVDADPTGFAGVSLSLTTFSPSFISARDGQPASTGGNLSASSTPLLKYWLETPPLTFQGSGQAWEIDIRASSDVAAGGAIAATVRIGQAYTRKVN